jgi:hypothetical protein
MEASSNASRGQSEPQRPRVLCGLQHRLLCSAPGIGLTAWFSYLSISSGSALDLVPVVASIVLTGVSFSAPMILTGEWNKPFPSASHLALISRTTQRLLTTFGFACICLPSLVRLAGYQ